MNGTLLDRRSADGEPRLGSSRRSPRFSGRSVARHQSEHRALPRVAPDRPSILQHSRLSPLAGSDCATWEYTPLSPDSASRGTNYGDGAGDSPPVSDATKVPPEAGRRVQALPPDHDSAGGGRRGIRHQGRPSDTVFEHGIQLCTAIFTWLAR